MAAVSPQSWRCLDVTLTSAEKSLSPKNSGDDIKQIKQTVVGRLNIQQMTESPVYIGCSRQQAAREKLGHDFPPLQTV